MHQSTTCNCLKISNIIQLWVNSYCCSHDKASKPPFVCWTRTGATFFVFQQFVNAHAMQHSRPCASNIIQKYSGVSGLTADKSHDLPTAELSDLVNSSSVPALHSLGVDNDFILSRDPQCTHIEYITCVSAGSVNCLFADCDQWCSWTFNCPDVTVQPVNYKEWSRLIDWVGFNVPLNTL